nr:hypothetical protein CJLB15_00102 [Campylobacter phage CJLB-15]
MGSLCILKNSERRSLVVCKDYLNCLIVLIVINVLIVLIVINADVLNAVKCLLFGLS